MDAWVVYFVGCCLADLFLWYFVVAVYFWHARG